MILSVGAFIIERIGTDLDDVLSKLEPEWRSNIYVIHQVFPNPSNITRVISVSGTMELTQTIANPKRRQ